MVRASGAEDRRLVRSTRLRSFLPAAGLVPLVLVMALRGGTSGVIVFLIAIIVVFGAGGVWV